MFDFTQKNKGLNVYFATVEPNSETGHYIYISGYGQTVAEKLNKYVETHQADDEDEEKLFEKWDDLIKKAKSEVGFKAIDEFEEGYIYVTTFQNGVGISEEDEAGSKRYTSRGRKRKAKISIINPEMSEGLESEEDDNSFDIGENLDDVDIDDDE